MQPHPFKVGYDAAPHAQPAYWGWQPYPYFQTPPVASPQPLLESLPQFLCFFCGARLHKNEVSMHSCPQTQPTHAQVDSPLQGIPPFWQKVSVPGQTPVFPIPQHHPELAAQKVSSERKPLSDSGSSEPIVAQLTTSVTGASSSSSGKHFVCMDCGKSFSSKSNLSAHLRTHSGEKPHVCGECGMRFVKKSNLTRHMLIHSGEHPYECTVCGKKFRQQRNLVRHQAIHSDEKPFVCSECGWSFRRKSNLISHVRIHTKEKPYICENCGRCFRQRNSLLTHIAAQCNDEMFSCQFCGSKFFQEGLLFNHIRSAHPSSSEHASTSLTGSDRIQGQSTSAGSNAQPGATEDASSLSTTGGSSSEKKDTQGSLEKDTPSPDSSETCRKRRRSHEYGDLDSANPSGSTSSTGKPEINASRHSKRPSLTAESGSS